MVPVIQMACQSATGGLKNVREKKFQAFSEPLPFRTLIIQICIGFHPKSLPTSVENTDTMERCRKRRGQNLKRSSV